jgi:hypothetical protein
MRSSHEAASSGGSPGWAPGTRQSATPHRHTPDQRSYPTPGTTGQRHLAHVSTADSSAVRSLRRLPRISRSMRSFLSVNVEALCVILRYFFPQPTMARPHGGTWREVAQGWRIRSAPYRSCTRASDHRRERSSRADRCAIHVLRFALRLGLVGSLPGPALLTGNDERSALGGSADVARPLSQELGGDPVMWLPSVVPPSVRTVHAAAPMLGQYGWLARDRRGRPGARNGS